MLKEQLVLKYDKLKFTLTGERSKETGKLVETMSMEYPGHETISLTTKLLDMDRISIPKQVLTMMKEVMRVASEDLRENHGFKERYRILVTDFKSKMNNEWIHHEFIPYLQGLRLIYEGHREIRINAKRVLVTLFDPKSSPDKLDVAFNYTGNRKYHVHCNISIRHDASIVKHLTFARDFGVDNIDYFEKQLDQWLDTLESRLKNNHYRIANMRNGAKGRFANLKPEITDIINRLNKGIDL